MSDAGTDPLLLAYGVAAIAGTIAAVTFLTRNRHRLLRLPHEHAVILD